MSKNGQNINDLINGLQSGAKLHLSRAITLIESQNKEDKLFAESLIENILSQTGKSVRLGITGAPGVGKSTFIDSFVFQLAQNKNLKIAVLTVDPSSSISGGSILGDKTRMESLIGLPNVYVRPSPAGNELGGVAKKTYESILLCEAAGYNYIIIETVGVGQSETIVKQMTDLLLLITIAGAGDDLQGIKRGIMEMVDVVFINKTDAIPESMKNNLILDLKNAFHLFPKKDIETQICSGSSLKNTGINELRTTIEEIFSTIKENGHLEKNRVSQKLKWMQNSFEQSIIEHIYLLPEVQNLKKLLLEKIEKNETSPLSASRKLLNEFLKNQNS